MLVFEEPILTTAAFTAVRLPLDSEHFNVSCGKVTLHRRLRKDDLEALLQVIKGIVFTTIVNVGNDMSNNQLLQRHGGFLQTDTIVKLRARVSMAAPSDRRGILLRNSFPRDDALLRIANSVFTHSRLKNDPKIPELSSSSFYGWWLFLSSDREDKYLITAQESEVEGFLLFRTSQDSLVIELIGVAPESGGKGIGTALVARLNLHALEHGISFLQTGTQLENIAALRFYQKLGFFVVQSSSTYHYWQ